jgi:pilus assembly protein Flp/PilA
MLKNVFSAVKGALADRKGVTAAEYAVLASGIVLAVSAAAILLGPRLAGILNGIVPAA